jgi:hypothetical protein
VLEVRQEARFHEKVWHLPDLFQGVGEHGAIAGCEKVKLVK